MDLYFDRGDHGSPSGHALLYFKVDTEPDKVYASYIVTLPIKADLTKYVPPLPGIAPGGATAQRPVGLRHAAGAGASGRLRGAGAPEPAAGR